MFQHVSQLNFYLCTLSSNVTMCYVHLVLPLTGANTIWFLKVESSEMIWKWTQVPVIVFIIKWSNCCWNLCTVYHKWWKKIENRSDLKFCLVKGLKDASLSVSYLFHNQNGKVQKRGMEGGVRGKHEYKVQTPKLTLISLWKFVHQLHYWEL